MPRWGKKFLLLFGVTVAAYLAIAGWEICRELPMIDRLTVRRGYEQACIVDIKEYKTTTGMGTILQMNLTVANAYMGPDGFPLPETNSLSRAYGYLLPHDFPFRLPRRGDILEFRTEPRPENDPSSYGKLEGAVLIGRATDELLAVCDERWEG